MTPEEENIKIGQDILRWLRQMPEIGDLHKMLISLAFASSKENGAEFDKTVADAVAKWAEMLCQNLELVSLFYRGSLIARCGEDGVMEVDFSKEAEEFAKATLRQVIAPDSDE